MEKHREVVLLGLVEERAHHRHVIRPVEVVAGDELQAAAVPLADVAVDQLTRVPRAEGRVDAGDTDDAIGIPSRRLATAVFASL